MLTVDSIQGYGRFAVLAMDESTGDVTIRRTDGEYVIVPRPLVTTPAERCPECGRAFALGDAGHPLAELRGICPHHAHHEYARLWRMARDTKLNRAARRRLGKRADLWLTRHLANVRGRESASAAPPADSPS